MSSSSSHLCLAHHPPLFWGHFVDFIHWEIISIIIVIIIMTNLFVTLTSVRNSDVRLLSDCNSDMMLDCNCDVRPQQTQDSDLYSRPQIIHQTVTHVRPLIFCQTITLVLCQSANLASDLKFYIRPQLRCLASSFASDCNTDTLLRLWHPTATLTTDRDFVSKLINQISRSHLTYFILW